MTRFYFSAACAMLALFACSLSAHAQTYTEAGDTGQLLGSAQNVGGAVNRIEGTLFNGDIDLFRADFDFTGTLTVNALALAGGLNMNLHSFNSAGNPRGANDDFGGSLNSQLTLAISPGAYYFGVGQNNLEALDNTNTIIQDNDNGTLNPAGVLAGWQGPGVGSGAYAITFSMPTAASAAVPEPGSIALLVGIALSGAAFLRRRLS